MSKSIEEKYSLRPLEFLKKLSTQRLLTLYRIERKKFNTRGYFCACCGEPMWKFVGHEHLEKEYDDWLKRLNDIKAILNTREHVKRGNKK